MRERGGVEEEVAAGGGGIGAGLVIEADADHRHAAAGAVVLIAAPVEAGGGEYQVGNPQGAQPQGAEIHQFMAGEGGVSRAMVLFVVFPVHIVQVAGQPGLAQSREEGGEALGENGPVRLDAADSGAHAELIPPDASEATGYRFVSQVQVYMRRQLGEMCGAFGVAENMQLLYLRLLHEPVGQPHGYIEDPHRFGGSKTLVSESKQQFHTRARTLAYFRLAVKFFSAENLRGLVLSVMMRRMADDKSVLRLTESLPGRMAGWLLAALWIFSMTAVDAHAFSAFPACVVLVAVVLLVLVALLTGRRVVRMSLPGWISLAAGVYFLARCLNSYAVVDSWGEAALILGACVYYIAGVYTAQNKNYGSVLFTLAAALLLNLLAMWAVRQPWFCLEWTGRALFTPEGENSLPATLFVYKNFAGVFFCAGGCALLAGAWGMRRGVLSWCGGVLGALAIVASFMCGTRAVYLALPLSLVSLWLLRVLVGMSHNRKIGAVNSILGVSLFVGALVAVTEFLFGSYLVGMLSGVDSHLRYLIWTSACEVLPSVPLWGCGANATVWEIVPYYSEWQLPNYAHNEYLQVWVDYGIVGLLLTLTILGLHLVQGWRCLCSEETTHPRLVLVVVCMQVVVVMAAYAVVDFPWHSFALVAMTAFSCGVLASPFVYREGGWFSARKWRTASQAPLVPVRAQKWLGKNVLILLAGGLAAVSGWLACTMYPAWYSQWRYNELSRNEEDARANERRGLIAGLLPRYPSPALMDTYFLLPPYDVDWSERERLLKMAFAANPKQLFTLAMLVDVLGQEKKYREAEQLMRLHYVGESMPGSLLNNWPAYYSCNLLMWGKHELQQGNHALALSLLDYALCINEKNHMVFNPVWRNGPQPWKAHGGIKPRLRQLLNAAQTDLRLLRLTGVQPDHSWKSPFAPGERPALYRSFLHESGI